jgi:hypothetical protein
MFEEFSVKYHLDEIEVQKITSLMNRWNKLYPNSKDDAASFFNFFMNWGCKHYIDDKIETMEEMIGRKEQQNV